MPIRLVNPEASNFTGVGCSVSYSLVEFESEAIGQCCIGCTALGPHEKLFLDKAISRFLSLALVKVVVSLGTFCGLCCRQSNRVRAHGASSGTPLPAIPFSLISGIFFSQVAIKSIRKDKIKDEQDLLHIRREIEIMSSLNHPHIIAIHEGMAVGHLELGVINLCVCVCVLCVYMILSAHFW